jgi:hypothetical protein
VRREGKEPLLKACVTHIEFVCVQVERARISERDGYSSTGNRIGVAARAAGRVGMELMDDFLAAEIAGYPDEFFDHLCFANLSVVPHVFPQIALIAAWIFFMASLDAFIASGIVFAGTFMRATRINPYFPGSFFGSRFSN